MILGGGVQAAKLWPKPIKHADFHIVFRIVAQMVQDT